MVKTASGSIMMHDLVLRNGSVLTPEGTYKADVAVSKGKIVAVGPELGSAERAIDCTDAWVGPGLVDIHTHLRDPGQTWKEDIGTGSAAAAAGGYTAIVAMPNTDPAIDGADLAHYVAEEGRRSGLVEVGPSGCLTLGRKGRRLSHIDELWNAGVRMFTDDGDSVADAALLQSAMEQVARLGGVVSQHAVDGPLSATGHMHEGDVSHRLGVRGIPREADEITIERDLDLARITGVRYHVQHLSTARSVELVEGAKAAGVAVTAEVTPHHLMFDHWDVEQASTSFKMMPPLRAASDRDALVEGLRSGIIDAVATDHAPHGDAEKDLPFVEAANGVTGLEWAAAVANQTADLDQGGFFDRMSIRPAEIGGFGDHGRLLEVGIAAHIVVFDPSVTWTPVATMSRSSNSPYLGKELRGRVRATVYQGRITYGGHP